LTATWAYLRLPETKDRTFGEMDIMFQRKVSARKFSKYQIDEDEEFAH
jgi:SP family general alpha glucoside:H+ symporter-like MFS transporter